MQQRLMRTEDVWYIQLTLNTYSVNSVRVLSVSEGTHSMLYCCVYCLYIFTVQITIYDASFYKSITSCISVTSYFYNKKLRSQSHKSQLKFSVWNYVFLQHSSICVTFNKKVCITSHFLLLRVFYYDQSFFRPDITPVTRNRWACQSCFMLPVNMVEKAVEWDNRKQAWTLLSHSKL